MYHADYINFTFHRIMYRNADVQNLLPTKGYQLRITTTFTLIWITEIVCWKW